ncbi:MAG: hypothetical protein ABIW84_03930 [Ilumatobacteraceae bacterium]
MSITTKGLGKPCAIGRNSFFGDNDNGGGGNQQFSILGSLDMGGNVYEDGTCP